MAGLAVEELVGVVVEVVKTMELALSALVVVTQW